VVSIAVALVVGLAFGILLVPSPPQALSLQSEFQGRLKAALDLVDYAPVNVTTSDLGIHLTSGCFRITLAALPAQTQSVANGLAGRIDVRPNAHDLMAEMFRALNTTLLQTRVERLAGDVYYGRLNLQQGSTILSLDARPSDAVALAVRLNGTVHVNSTLLQKEGRGIC
jgi:bifunctional DNase/RNase